MPQTILITGTSRGLGRELAIQAQQRGDRVIATMRAPHASPALPPEIEVLPLEVTKTDAHAELARQMEGVAIDLLVCSAGVFPGRGGLREAQCTELDWFIGLMTNVAGPYFAVRALLPNLRLAGRAKVAIISSAMGSSENAAGGSYIYRASKAGAVNLARNLAVELAPLGIAVGAYHPGWVRTDMGTGAAPVDLNHSATGLLERFAELSSETSGIFEDYLGNPIPF
ncbi:SDR family oxidoreductase [Rhodobacteraceae bacterium DSL-40]|uniref:SDR family oxidoreductase n=1 Tax=Amaricoccus sp. B4 TaxID=3368557 RepID=UPI000DADDC10